MAKARHGIGKGCLKFTNYFAGMAGILADGLRKRNCTFFLTLKEVESFKKPKLALSSTRPTGFQSRIRHTI